MRPGPLQPGDVPAKPTVRERTGDVVECASCGLVFVLRSPTLKDASCRRCDSDHVAKWRPGDAPTES